MAALDGITRVVSRGEQASPVADGAERADEAVSDDIRKVFERAESETDDCHGWRAIKGL